MSYSEQLLDAIEKHDFTQNRQLLNQALKQDDPEVLASLADNLTDIGFSDLAKEVYRYLIAQFPKEDLFKVYLAEILLNDGNDDDGLSLLYDIEPTSDAYLESLLVQADYYQTNGLLETARDKLNQALRIAPQEDAVKFGLAELDYMSGQYEAALALYKDLLTRQKHFGEINLQVRIINALAKLGRYEEAAELIKQNESSLLDIDSQYQAGLVLLAVDDYDGAIKYLKSVIDQSADYVNAYPLLAQAYAKDDQPENALDIAQTGLMYNQYDDTLYLIGADAATKLNHLDVAEDLLTTGLKNSPDNNDMRLQLSNLYLHQHQYQKNINLFKDVDDENLEPQDHWNLAVSYQALENYDKARSEYLLAYTNFQNNPEFLRQMIGFFQEISEKDTLKALVAKYLKLVPDDYDMQELNDELKDE